MRRVISKGDHHEWSRWMQVDRVIPAGVTTWGIYREGREETSSSIEEIDSKLAGMVTHDVPENFGRGYELVER